MTDDIAAFAEEEGAAATRRAAHLVWLLLIDKDPVGFQTEVQKLAIGDDADPVFAAAVTSYVVQIAVKFGEVWPRDGVQEFLADILAASPPSDARDLGDSA